MSERMHIRPMNEDWPKSVTSNPFIQGEICKRDPVDVMMAGAHSRKGDYYLLNDCRTLLRHARATGVLDTTDRSFIYAAKGLVRGYWLRHPIRSIRAQLRR